MRDAVIPDLSKNLDWDPSVANPHHSDDADPDRTFHFDVDRILFVTLKRIRIPALPFTLMRIRILASK